MTQISEECYGLAGSLFKNWVFIDSARRYAQVEEKDKALAATVNARASVYDSAKEGAMTDDEATALNRDLNEVTLSLLYRGSKEARDRLESLSEQVFMSSLEKVVDCEIAKR